jgi:hypothetical protein
MLHSRTFQVQYAVNQSGAGDELRIAAYEVSLVLFPTPSIQTNACVYTGTTAAAVITLTNGVSLSLKGGYWYQHALVTNWIQGIAPALVDGQNTRRGLYAAGDGVTNHLELLEFARGAADRGANVYAVGGGLQLLGTPVHEGNAVTAGGGVFMRGVDFSVSLGSFSNLALPQMTGLLPIYSNTAASGGGLYLDGGYPLLTTVGILGNRATEEGGGIYVRGGIPSIVGGAVRENQAGVRGGAIYLSNSVARVGGMLIVSNAAAAGGGIYLDGPFALTLETATLIANNYLYGNAATGGPGGGIYFNAANVGVVNNILANNAATNGAAAYLYASSPRFFQNTIADNPGDSAIRVTHSPGAGQWIIYQTWGYAYSNWLSGIPLPSWPVFTNTILSGHGIALQVDSSGNSLFENKVQMGYTVWWSNATDTAGAGQITRTHDFACDPLYTSQGVPPIPIDPYHLKTNSPAIDVGIAGGLALPGTDLILDIDGQLRPAGNGMDIGADEVAELFPLSAAFVPAAISCSAQPGTIVTNNHLLLNSGTLNDSYNLAVSNLLPWTAGVLPAFVTLAAQTYTSIAVTVTVPPGALHGQTNVTLVTAVSTADTARAAYASDATAVTTNAYEPVTRYVWQGSPTPLDPYTSWATAGHEIQTVVDAARAGDTVIVAEGVYDKGGRTDPDAVLTNRVYVTNSVTIQSERGPDNTYIVGQADALLTNGPSAVRCAYLAANSELSGFSLINGHTAINPAQVTGGGAVLFDDATLKSCVVRGNGAHGYGGGVCLNEGGTAVNCLVLDNAVTAPGGSGGGIRLQIGGTVNNCTIIRNDAPAGGGVSCISSGVLYNTVIYSNSAPFAPDHFDDGPGMRYVYSCTPLTSGAPVYVSCVTNEPRFVNQPAGNYRLRYGSPCVDAGTNLPAAVTNDIEGNIRPLDGNWDGTNATDMGCYEYNPQTADSNGDGLPDGWCRSYGLDPNDPSVATNNPDRDAHTTGQEYIADTNPTNAASDLAITGITNRSPVTVYFLSSSNRSYSLQAHAAFPTGQWSLVAGQTNVTGRGGPDWLDDTNAPASERFYRLNVNLQ